MSHRNPHPSELADRVLRAALVSVPQALMIVDSEGKIAFVNRRFEDVTHSASAELKGRPLASACFLAQESESFSFGEDYWEGEVGWRDDGGTVTAYSVLSVCLRGDNGEHHGYLLSFSRLAASSIAPLQRHHRLAALGSLSGGIAHDLNNVLTGVLGHVSFLRLSLAEHSEHSDSILAIEDGARRAASMTQQILEFARGTEAELQPVNLSAVVLGGLNILRAGLPKNISLELDGLQKEVYVIGNESQLSQLVMNLAVNARDALPEGGSIRISIKMTSVGNGGSIPAGDYGQLEIIDNGVGIPETIRGKIFEPFFTTKSHVGTGLGLSTVYGIVQRHQGRIEVESIEGQGSCFRVQIPAAPEIPHLDPADEEEEKLPTGTERILVVDDEEAVRLVIQRSLEHLGYAVDVAPDGPSAIDQYRSEPTAYRLVILDMMMPRMPGDEVFLKLKAINANVPVLIASGYSSDHRTKAILEAGGLGFLKKPFAVEELAREVRRCLDLKK